MGLRSDELGRRKKVVKEMEETDETRHFREKQARDNKKKCIGRDGRR